MPEQQPLLAELGRPLPATYEVIAEAELAYSEERLKDIAAEYRFPYPGLRSVFETFRGKTYTFERAEREKHCLVQIVPRHEGGEDAGSRSGLAMERWMAIQSIEALFSGGESKASEMNAAALRGLGGTS